MALDKDTLGTALLSAVSEFNDSDISPENLPEARANFWKKVAEEIIKHIKTNGEVSVMVNTTGNATAQTGTGTGNIT